MPVMPHLDERGSEATGSVFDGILLCPRGTLSRGANEVWLDDDRDQITAGPVAGIIYHPAAKTPHHCRKIFILDVLSTLLEINVKLQWVTFEPHGSTSRLLGANMAAQ